MGEGTCGAGVVRTVFDDEAATPINSGSVPFAGSFRPEQSLSVFDGQNARGTWQLMVRGDGKDESRGSLTGWSLTFANY